MIKKPYYVYTHNMVACFRFLMRNPIHGTICGSTRLLLRLTHGVQGPRPSSSLRKPAQGKINSDNSKNLHTNDG